MNYCSFASAIIAIFILPAVSLALTASRAKIKYRNFKGHFLIGNVGIIVIKSEEK